MSWNKNLTNEHVDKALASDDFTKSMENFTRACQKMTDYAESERIKAGNNLMNYITQTFQEKEKYYRDEYGQNWLEVMNEDEVWRFSFDEEFWKLMEKYYSHTVG